MIKEIITSYNLFGYDNHYCKIYFILLWPW